MSDHEFWNELGTIFNAVLTYQKKNIEFNNEFISPWIRLGDVFHRENASTSAIQALRQAIQIDPLNARNWSDLGDALFKAGSYGEASEAYQKAIEQEPTAGWPLCNLALALVEQDKCQDAIPLYTKSIELFQDEKEKAVAWNRLGNAYRRLNDYKNAFTAYIKADELDMENAGIQDPHNKSPREPIIDEQFPTTSPDPKTMVPINADESLEKEISSTNGFTDEIPESHIDTPTLSFTKSIRSELPSFPFPETDSPSDSTGLIDLKDATTSQEIEEKTPEAENVSTLSTSDDEDVIVDLESQEKKESEPGDSASPAEPEDIITIEKMINEVAYEEYLKDFIGPTGNFQDQSGDQDPSLSPVVENRGVKSLKVEIDTQDAPALNELGNVYFKSGAYDDAITAYSQAIELDQDFAWAYSNLGLAYVQKGRFSEAILLYQHSIELFTANKDKAVTWNRLGNLYRRQQVYEKAIAAYQTADELDPDNISVALQSRLNLLGNMMDRKPVYSL